MLRHAGIAFLVLLTLPALAQNPLREAVAEGVRSIVWKIPTDGVTICCCNENQSYSSGKRNWIEHQEVLIRAELEGRRIRRLRMLEPTCPVQSDRFVVASPEASLDFLLEHLRDDGDEEKFISAIAMHDHPRTVPELIQLARRDTNRDVRRQAIFWLGQKAGEKSAGELRRAVDEDPDDDVRQHAVFAISQLPRERSVPLLIDLVKTHKRPAIRKRAMFWLAQSDDPRALELIEEILLK